MDAGARTYASEAKKVKTQMKEMARAHLEYANRWPGWMLYPIHTTRRVGYLPPHLHFCLSDGRHTWQGDTEGLMVREVQHQLCQVVLPMFSLRVHYAAWTRWGGGTLALPPT